MKRLFILLTFLPAICLGEEWIEIFPGVVYVSSMTEQLETGEYSTEVLFNYDEPNQVLGPDGIVWMVSSMVLLVQVDCEKVVGKTYEKIMYAFPMAKGSDARREAGEKPLDPAVTEAVCDALGT